VGQHNVSLGSFSIFEAELESGIKIFLYVDTLRLFANAYNICPAMARPEEKTQSMLHRYLRSRNGEESARSVRRPYLATLCEDVGEAQRWLRQVISDISRKVSDIQNRTFSTRCRPAYTISPVDLVC
jgi:hypothetical protein